MKQAKIYKILLTVVALVMFIMAGLMVTASVNDGKQALAETAFPTFLTSEWSDENSKTVASASVELTENSANVTIAENKAIRFSNSIAANALELSLTVTDLSAVKITFNTNSYVVTGNEKSLSSYLTTIAHTLTINLGGNFVFDESTSTSTVTGSDVIIKIKTENNVMSVSVNDSEFVSANGSIYKVEQYGVCEVRAVTISSEIADGATQGNLAINYINQNYNDVNDTYLQEFKFTEGNPIKTALPMVDFGSSMYVKTATCFEPIVYKYEQYKLSSSDLKAYSVLESVKTSNLYLAKPDVASDIALSGEEKPKSVVFINTDTIAIMSDDYKNESDENIVLGTLKVKVEDKQNLSTENVAPSYIDASANEDIIRSYKDALTKASKSGNYSVRLGDKVTVPSMENLVYDDYTSFSKLTHTLYYKTPAKSGSTSGWDITTDVPGTYSFHVIFKDAQGESMDSETIFGTDSADEVTTASSAFVFSFEIKDDAPLSIQPISNQPNGYLNTKYTASSFVIKGNATIEKYELWYNKVAEATVGDLDESAGWVRIPALEDIDDAEIPAGFTYNQIKKIAYDGERTFTPVKLGKYVIKCTIDSETSISSKAQNAKASVVVKSAPRVVTPAYNWASDNVNSIVFLSIGTACLVGIVALLFIKPKAKDDKKSK